MIKALLIDGDGIVMKPRDKYFSERLREEGYDFPEEREKEFFKEIYPDIRLGKKDLRIEVEKLMRDWGWDGTVDELLKYWFSYENDLDEEVIDILQKLRKNGIKVYLASDHSEYRKNDLWDRVGLKKYFDGYFFSCDLGVTKDDVKFFEKVLDELSLQSIEVMFLDDEEENVGVARKMGIRADVYESVSQLDGIGENLPN